MSSSIITLSASFTSRYSTLASSQTTLERVWPLQRLETGTTDDFTQHTGRGRSLGPTGHRVRKNHQARVSVTTCQDTSTALELSCCALLALVGEAHPSGKRTRLQEPYGQGQGPATFTRPGQSQLLRGRLEADLPRRIPQDRVLLAGLRQLRVWSLLTTLEFLR